MTVTKSFLITISSNSQILGGIGDFVVQRTSPQFSNAPNAIITDLQVRVRGNRQDAGSPAQLLQRARVIMTAQAWNLLSPAEQQAERITSFARGFPVGNNYFNQRFWRAVLAAAARTKAGPQYQAIH